MEATEALGALFVVLLAAKLGDEVCKRVGQPAVVGEVLAGVVVGPSVLGLVSPSEALELFSELGVVFLLFWVGLHTSVSGMRAVGRVSVAVGTLGGLVPLAAGFGLGQALGESAAVSLFLGVALMATSVGITSAVLAELGVLDRPSSRTVLGAAVVDDIIALTLLAVAVGLAEDELQVGRLLAAFAVSLAFVLFVGAGGTRLLSRWPQLLRAPRFAESPLLPAVLLCLGLAALADEIGLAAIIGAFLAGVVVSETKDQSNIESEIAPLYAVFPPFFFAFIGVQLPLGELGSASALALLALVVLVAVVSKALASYWAARSLGREEAALVAIGMVPRGEVGIVVAGLASAEGVIEGELFAVIIGMSVLTTLLAPPALRRRLQRPAT